MKNFKEYLIVDVRTKRGSCQEENGRLKLVKTEHMLPRNGYPDQEGRAISDPALGAAT
jgi:hypothetical protein